MKTCAVCKEIKPFDSYYNSKTAKDGKGYRCKSCDDLARRKWRENNLESSKKSSRRNQLWSTYRMTLDEYDVLFKKQDYKCAICVTKENKVSHNDCNFSVDYCHETGKIRGLLCNQCNRALGMFQDSVDILETATTYLKSYK